MIATLRTISPFAYRVLHCARFPHQQTVGTSSMTSAISIRRLEPGNKRLAEIGAQSIADHWNIIKIHKIGQSVYFRFRKELRFIHQNASTFFP